MLHIPNPNATSITANSLLEYPKPQGSNGISQYHAPQEDLGIAKQSMFSSRAGPILDGRKGSESNSTQLS